MPYNTAQKFLNSIKKLIKTQNKWNENTEQQIVILQKKVDNIIKLMETMQKNQDSMVEVQHKLQENQYVIQEGQNSIQENQNFMKESGHKQYEQMDKTMQILSELKTDAQYNCKCYEKDFQTVIANTNEIMWACIFNNAIDTETWLKNKSFYPGRWAIGYPVLYVLYRILNEVKPKSILELGLGQSTKMITQYAAAYEDVKHYVVEHDDEWIHFFERDTAVSANTEIVKLDREMKTKPKFDHIADVGKMVKKK